MKILKTPESRFENLKDYDFAANYLTISDGLEMHYLDEGPKSAGVVLLLHGEPTWSYLYRKMIPIFVNAGFRVIAPDLIGFGKSDKPTEQSDYSYARHLKWLQDLILGLKLNKIHLFCQDWGGLLGLRLVAAHQEIFSKVLASNTFLPTGQLPPSESFLNWRSFSQNSPKFQISKVVQMGSSRELSPSELQAYDAPFPTEVHKAGARVFPSLVPIDETEAEAIANQKAWESLATFEKPFLIIFGSEDQITRGGEKYFQKIVPGAKSENHLIVKANHFIQEDLGSELGKMVADFFQKKV